MFMMESTTPTVIVRRPDPAIDITVSSYQHLYAYSIQQPDAFWDEQARRVITWTQTWDMVREGDFDSLEIRWFVKGKLNACYNCLDRHLPERAEQLALIWEGSDPQESHTYTYQSLHQEVCRFANVLRAQGIRKGDRVGIYLPMIPQLVIAMLACARIGAVHSVVFSGFSAEALAVRLQDTQAHILITADESIRGNQYVPLKQHADTAVQSCPSIRTVLVVRRTGRQVSWSAERDVWYHEAMQDTHDHCPVEIMDAADPLFILYTSGSTGKPKGIVHGTGGYMVYTTLSYAIVFDHRPGDVLFCTADPGWITGHSYLLYGPLSNGGTTLLFEGLLHYPSYARYWQIIDKYHVTTFYTSPTALRTLRAEGDDWVHSTQRKSLRCLGTVGEPISPEVWLWYYQVVGEERCPIMNTWWQTETGGIVLSDLPSASEFFPGAVVTPFLGILPDIMDEQGHTIQDERPGRLVMKQPWPGMMQTILGNHQAMLDNYLRPVPGCYLSGDEAHRDSEGHWVIIGRTDDVIKVSGHRLCSAELEAALISYPGVAEAAVVGMAHPLKGECIVAFVTLMPTLQPNATLQHHMQQHVRSKISPIATPEKIYWAPGLPKTRSGKIMRRVLRKILQHDFEHIGDISTLVNPEVVQQLIELC